MEIMKMTMEIITVTNMRMTMEIMKTKMITVNVKMKAKRL